MEEEFSKGFNQGYILNKYSKDMGETVSESFQGSNDYIRGFDEGGKEASLEFQQNRFDELNKLRNGKDKDVDIER